MWSLKMNSWKRGRQSWYRTSKETGLLYRGSIMINKLIFPIILQLAGVLVVMAEIILPSAGLLSIIAAA